ncbi:diacylglycerol/lipid kinase family protein [Bifidobacterium moraviense]|nr:diacylglycerol kinase family protein [Bifidobacterium sp. DSM 109958]
MPQPLILALCVIALVLCLAAAVLLFWRVRRRQRLNAVVESRDDDAEKVDYAFIINPSKPHAEELRARIDAFCEAKGISHFFIDTQLDKDGNACAREAVARGATGVVAVGGDGTVRTVASAMAKFDGIPMGIVPIGTANLFARNMGIPLDDVDAALTVATSHGSRHIDMGRLCVLDSDDPDHDHGFLIVAGVGFDALMIDDTNPTLKKNISWLAYFASATKHLFSPKNHGDLTITDPQGNAHVRTGVAFRTFMAGNCGQIPALSLMPEAVSDDGYLDFELIDTTGGLIGWANLFGDVVHQTITGRAKQSPLSTNSTIDQFQGVRAEIRLERPALAQVDGDVLGETRHIAFSIQKRALCVRVPEVPAEPTGLMAL